MDIVNNGLMVHPALAVDFLVVVSIAIELRPYRNHETATHLVNTVEHSLRIGIAGRLKLMGAPLVLSPVIPVLHNIIAGNLTLAELRQVFQNLVLSLVALTALPETQHPLRIDWCLARQGAIA